MQDVKHKIISFKKQYLRLGICVLISSSTHNQHIFCKEEQANHKKHIFSKVLTQFLKYAVLSSWIGSRSWCDVDNPCWSWPDLPSTGQSNWLCSEADQCCTYLYLAIGSTSSTAFKIQMFGPTVDPAMSHHCSAERPAGLFKGTRSKPILPSATGIVAIAVWQDIWKQLLSSTAFRERSQFRPIIWQKCLFGIWQFRSLQDETSFISFYPNS